MIEFCQINLSRVCQFGSQGLFLQEIQESLTQVANFLRVLGVKEEVLPNVTISCRQSPTPERLHRHVRALPDMMSGLFNPYNLSGFIPSQCFLNLLQNQAWAAEGDSRPTDFGLGWFVLILIRIASYEHVYLPDWLTVMVIWLQKSLLEPGG